MNYVIGRGSLGEQELWDECEERFGMDEIERSTSET
jgi:hypothetical protein